MGPPQWSDLGMYVQTVMLLARGYGLDSCGIEAWTFFLLSLIIRTISRAFSMGMPCCRLISWRTVDPAAVESPAPAQNQRSTSPRRSTVGSPDIGSTCESQPAPDYYLVSFADRPAQRKPFQVHSGTAAWPMDAALA